ncbi:hypothetical protein [Curtobacterium citreum]|uniref:hypothetical protein n=1 Tax=Curtobacterium citreum TaxID=2036 RepID=UPI0007DF8A23|nr:hypothetical protein [Curtobacterium citreum]KTR11064.1 hypothetical protein NS330_12945 [Curtobacterium citreum]
MTNKVRFQGQTFRVVDLFTDTDVLSDHVFRECRIVGPAVLSLEVGGMWDGNTFAGSREGMLWQRPKSEQIWGAVTFRNTDFIDCHFERIGLTGPDEFILGLTGSFPRR